MRVIFVILSILFLQIEVAAANGAPEPVIKMVAYPNPIAVGQTLNIDVDGLNGQAEDAYISIYSIIGTKVFERVVEPTSDFKIRLTIDKTFTSNIYFITLASSDVHITKKLLVNN